jgi:hypothetical protein
MIPKEIAKIAPKNEAALPYDGIRQNGETYDCIRQN